MTCASTLSEKFTAADKSLRCFYLLNKSFPTLHNQKRSWVLIRFFKPACNASGDEKNIWTPAISPWTSSERLTSTQFISCVQGVCRRNIYDSLRKNVS